VVILEKPRISEFFRHPKNSLREFHFTRLSMSTGRKRSYTMYQSKQFKPPAQTVVVSSGRVLSRPRTQQRLSVTEVKDITVRSTLLGLAASTATASAGVLLNPIAQGTTASTRIGRRLKMTSMFLRWYVTLAPTTTGATPVRLIIVYDAQSNGAAPAITDILLTDEISSPNNLSNSRRFKVLVDEQRECIGTSGPQSFMAERFVKLDKLVEYNTDAGATVAAITSGAVYAFVYQAGSLATANATGVFYSRIRFVDS